MPYRDSVLIKRTTEDICVLGSTEHTGLGIFATKAIRKGEFIADITGKKKSTVNQTVEDVLGHYRWIGLGNNVWIEPEFPFSHINHSCSPNAGVRGMTSMCALRDIAQGEEITFDYATTEEDARWVMVCNCLTPNCRKEVRSIHFLPPETFESYLPFVPDYFQNVYRMYYQIPAPQNQE